MILFHSSTDLYQTISLKLCHNNILVKILQFIPLFICLHWLKISWIFSIKFMEHSGISISFPVLLIFRFSFLASISDHSFSIIGWDYLQIWIRFIIFPILFPFKKQFNEFKDVDQVCCDGCNVWVHPECENISSRLFKVCLIYLIYELWC